MLNYAVLGGRVSLFYAKYSPKKFVVWQGKEKMCEIWFCCSCS